MLCNNSLACQAYPHQYCVCSRACIVGLAREASATKHAVPGITGSHVTAVEGLTAACSTFGKYSGLWINSQWALNYECFQREMKYVLLY